MTVIEERFATFTGEIHPYADRWPMRSADEIEAMADSISVNGLRFPIILTPDGVLVDGRNRLRACEVAGVPPYWEVREELTGEDAIVAFIWDANGDRRDMSKGAKAMLAALMPGSVRLLSNHQGVSHAYVVKARQVIEFCDADVIEAVIADTLSLNDAYAQAQEIKATVQADQIAERKRKAQEKAEAKKRQQLLDDLRTNRPDLADLVDDNKLSVDDALTIRHKDQAAQERREEAERQTIRNLVNDAHLAFTIIDGYRHHETVARIRAHWAPQVRDWTAEDLRELASILTDIADQWETL